MVDDRLLRDDPVLVAGEIDEQLVLLLRELDEEGLRALVLEIVNERATATGQKPTAKDMGPVIKEVQARLQASGVRAEGRIVSESVKAALAG